MKRQFVIAVTLSSVVACIGWYVFAQQTPSGGTLANFAPGQVLTAAQLNAIVAQVKRHRDPGE